MKFVAAIFVGVLLFAHAEGDLERLLERPLSQFRDEPIGYVLFGLLLLAGGLYTRALFRCRREGEASVSVVALLLLVLVAATHSGSPFHLLCAFLLLALLFFYYAGLLYRARSIWLAGHLAVPVLLVLLTQAHSYGLWQKTFILYFIGAVAVHHHLLGRRKRPEVQRGHLLRRRKVYVLEEGTGWARRSSARGET
jgi:hypothetical protein